jgi:hypothetical protein
MKLAKFIIEKTGAFIKPAEEPSTLARASYGL